MILVILTVLGCRVRPEPAPAVVAPAPAVEARGVSAPVGKPDSARAGYTAADVRFMQGMIAHHAQAIEMTSLIASRSARPDMRLLGERISVSQRDEIAMMQRWLRERGEVVPPLDVAAMHATGHALMPGMATREEMARLSAATGAEFDREFLRLMIRHHEGALVMVTTLFSHTGAGQDTEMYFFASDVDADQRAEISRMRAMLARLPS